MLRAQLSANRLATQGAANHLVRQFKLWKSGGVLTRPTQVILGHMRLNFLSVIMKGPQIFQGYWKRPEATADAFMTLDGKQFFRSGDLGRVDEEGYFFITDRLKRMINASGFKVWPAEVEALMLKHPAIQEACIISTRDVYRGESVKAVVVLRADAKGKTSEDDIIHWCKDNMAAYKYPRVAQFVDALPKSGAVKVMWRALQEAEAGKAS